MHVWNVLHAVSWKYRTQKLRKKSPSAHHRITLSGYIFTTKAYIDNRTKIVKRQYLLHMSSQYAELRPINGWDLLASLGHPSKFHRVSRLDFVTAPTSLNGRQPNFARFWSSPSLVYYVYTTGDFCRLTEFCQLQNSVCVRITRSPILAALLHGTRALVGVSQTLWRWAEGATYIRQGGHHVGHRSTF